MPRMKKTQSKQPTDQKAFKPLANGKGFGFAQHQYHQFHAIVPAGVTKEVLQDRKFWSNVASNFRSGSEIRVVADDSSWMARVYIAYAQGTVVHPLIESFTRFGDSIDLAELNVDDEFKIKNCGAAGWSVIKKDNAETVFEGIPTVEEAFAQLAQYKQSLAA